MDSEFREKMENFQQNKLFIYSPHPFYSDPSIKLLNEFKHERLERGQGTEMIISSFLGVVKNPGIKQQDKNEFRYYLFDLCLLHMELKHISSKTKTIEKNHYIDNNREEFTQELNRYCGQYNSKIKQVLKTKDIMRENERQMDIIHSQTRRLERKKKN